MGHPLRSFISSLKRHAADRKVGSFEVAGKGNSVRDPGCCLVRANGHPKEGTSSVKKRIEDVVRIANDHEREEIQTYLKDGKIETEVKLTGILCLGELQPGEVLALHRFSSDFNIHNLSVIKPCKPKNLVRSYASVVRLNGGIYVFGGGNGYIWYDTIESYNPVHDNWTMHPSLNQKKGSLSDNDNFHAASTSTTFLVFHPQDNNIIAIGMDDSSIQIYNVQVDEVKTKLKVHQEENHWSFDFDNASPEPYLIARRGRASGYEDEKNK
ncbi:hypothetical protein ACSQ67_024466 [Phaseolus vulgaris]